MSGLQERLAESLRAFREVFTNPNLRRVQLAFAGSVTGQWAYGVGLVVFAYHAGGASAVGLVGLIRYVSAAISAPFVALLGDRYRRERVMLASDLVRVVALTVAAVGVFADMPVGAIYALAGLVGVASTAFDPAERALLPSIVRTPEELTASNVTSSTIESIGSFAGPAIGGLLLATTSTGVVFAVTAGTFLWSALLVSRIRAESTRDLEQAASPGGIAREALAGFRTIAVERRLRLLVGLFAAQTLVAGALNVLIVVSALNLLDLGRSGVGFMFSAIGIGGLVGAFGALALVGRKRLASDFGIGIVLWGVPLVLIGIWPQSAAALVLLGLLGVGNTLVDVAALTLLQRAVPDDVLARVFGVLESLQVGTIGFGAILAPFLISGLGIRGALIVTGAFLPVLAALFWRRLNELDAMAAVPVRALGLLRAIPMFAPLRPATLEHLGSSLVPLGLPAGTDVFRQGDHGDRFYIVAEGEVDVTVDESPVRPLGPGDHFGEIALLRDVPRTATVTARTNVELFALEREEFIAAVTGHPSSADAADAVIGTRLGSLRTGVGSV